MDSYHSQQYDSQNQNANQNNTPLQPPHFNAANPNNSQNIPPLNNAQYGYPPPPPNRSCLFLILGFILAFALVILGIGLLGKGCSSVLKSFTTNQEAITSSITSSASRVSEHVIAEGEKNSNKRIAVIAIQGVIQFGGRGSYNAMAENIILQLKHAQKDKNIVAVILDMNTPGGEVVASDEILQQVLKCHQANKPVITCMRSMAASGGYFIASGSDWIIANRMTFTGSIGVIISSYQFKGLLDKIGVKPVVYRSGAMKDMLSPSREPTPQEAAYIQKLVTETFHEFCQVVSNGRKTYNTPQEIAQSDFGDGRVLSGTSAKQFGLVDQLGYFSDAVQKARELSNAPHASVVRLSYNTKLWDILLSMKAPEKTLHLEGLISPGSVTLEPGKLYFLPIECVQTGK